MCRKREIRNLLWEEIVELIMCYCCVWIREEWTKCPEKLQSIFWNVWNRLMQPCQVLQQFSFHFKHNFVSFNNFWFLYNVTYIKECQVFPQKISRFLKTIWQLKSAFLCSSLFSNRLPTDLDLEKSHWAAITWGI